MKIFEFVLCLIEMASSCIFSYLLMQKRFRSPVAYCLIGFGSAAAVFFCSELNIIIKALIIISILFLSNLILYRDNVYVKLTYPALFLYILYIQDIILGTFMTIFTDKDFIDVFYSDFAQRVVISLIVKIFNILTLYFIYKKYSKIINSNLAKKYWKLFTAIIYFYLIITVVFIVVYPQMNQKFGSNMMCFIISITFFIMSVIVIYFFAEICTKIHNDEKMYILESNYNYLNEQIAIQYQNSEKLKKVRHDIRSHLININCLIENAETDEAKSLLKQVSDNIDIINIKNDVYTENSLIDAIISVKLSLCKNKNIHFKYFIEPISNIKIEPIDISSLLSNLFDNAIEAASKTENPYIVLKIYKYKAYYAFYIENSCKNIVLNNEKILVTTKSDNFMHGYGTQIINDIVHKYDGESNWKFENEIFKTTVLLKI